jgi:hypothetical protein
MLLEVKEKKEKSDALCLKRNSKKKLVSGLKSRLGKTNCEGERR